MGFINNTNSSNDKEILGRTPQPVIADPSLVEGSHLNFMGGISFTPGDPITRLAMAASSCFFGEPMYYHEDKTDSRPKRMVSYYKDSSIYDLDKLRKVLNAVDPQEWRGLSPAKMMEKAIDEALDFDVEKTLQFARHLRQDLNFRTTPQVIMVRAAVRDDVKGTGLITKYAQGIMNRLDEVMVQYSYFKTLGLGTNPPQPLKRNWARRLARASEYELAKYKRTSRETNIYDVVNITHPKSENIDKLMKDQISLGTDSTSGPTTWESIRSASGSWKDAFEVMGHQALLMNLRNLIQSKDVSQKDIADKLIAGAVNGRMMPFRYVSAYSAVEAIADPILLDGIEEAMKASMVNLPHFNGNVMSLVDNSGSAHGTPISNLSTMTVARIGNMMGVITSKISDNGFAGVFGDDLETRAIRKSSSIFDEAKSLDRIGDGIGFGTENGIWLFFKKAIEEKEHWDHIFVYSDMQAGHGGLYGTQGDFYSRTRGSLYYEIDGKSFGIGSGSRYIDIPRLIDKYRKSVNKDVKIYLVQIAGYQDTLVPEFYENTYILGGWSDNVLKFAAAMGELSQ